MLGAASMKILKLKEWNKMSQEMVIADGYEIVWVKFGVNEVIVCIK